MYVVVTLVNRTFWVDELSRIKNKYHGEKDLYYQEKSEGKGWIGSLSEDKDDVPCPVVFDKKPEISYACVDVVNTTMQA